MAAIANRNFRRVAQVVGGVSLTLISLACGRFGSTSGESNVQDFTGPQLMGHGMAAGTVSLTFDDGPGPRTAELSRFLKNEGVQATFFVQGNNAAQYPEVIKQLQQDGHLIANHSYTHPRMTQSSDPVAEVRRTDELIKSYVDKGHFLFRAPYGDWSSRVATVLNSAGLTKYVGSVFWDIGGERVERADKTLSAAADWACWSYGDSVEKCLGGYMNETRELNRGIVLMHDVHSRTIDMTKLMVKQLKQEGFDFIRTDDAPSVVAGLERRTDKGGSPLPTPDALACPEGFSPTAVGTAGGMMCLSASEAQGPFTQGMQDLCREKGGGDACANARWSRGMAVWLHGPGRCPAGAEFDAEVGACVEGENAFGPFSKQQVKRCKALSANPDSPVCNGNRWSRGFLASVGQG
jgi:peptidoglycan/xylan/chitin deacetylase (PgdA/CDA1 family)